MTYEELKFENIKLRDRVELLEFLCVKALRYAEEGELDAMELCDMCEHVGTCENHPASSCKRPYDNTSSFLRTYLRELGIEVQS